MHATNKARSSYLNNPPVMSTPLGKYSCKKLVMDQSDHTNRSGVERTLLPIITKYYGTKVFTLGGLQPFGSSGLS